MNITQTGNFIIKIFNTLGQEIFTEKLKQFKGVYEKQIDLSARGGSAPGGKGLAEGVYRLQLITDKGTIHKNIVIE